MSPFIHRLTTPRHSIRNLFFIVLSLTLAGCSAPGDNVAEKKLAAEKMRSEILTRLYKQNTGAKSVIQSSAGYAVFSNANVYILFVSAGSGYGVVTDNSSGKKTYMKMAAGGLGFGAGVKDYRLVIAFKNRKTLQDFIEKGWQFGGQADAAAKAQEKGAAVGAEIAVGDVHIYELTESGLALQITAQGTKFWKDENLN